MNFMGKETNYGDATIGLLCIMMYTRSKTNQA